MFAGLVASARELRNPLTVGYSALFTLWVLAGDSIHHAASQDALGRRLLHALHAAGGATDFALATFGAAVIGSVLWNGLISRLVRALTVRFAHPDWNALVDSGRAEVRKYEEYNLPRGGGTASGFGGGGPKVPSRHWGDYLQERVENRERRAADISFRVTLALALIPMGVALGIAGGGLWLLSLLAVPLVWLDVALLKHTSLREAHLYEAEDLQSQLDRLKAQLDNSKAPRALPANATDQQRDEAERQRLQSVASLEAEIPKVEERIAAHELAASKPIFRIFAGILGDPR